MTARVRVVIELDVDVEAVADGDVPTHGQVRAAAEELVDSIGLSACEYLLSWRSDDERRSRCAR